MHPVKIFSLFFLPLLPLLAFSQDPITGNQALDDKIIASWIDSQKKLAEWGDKNASEIARYELQAPRESNPLEISVADMLHPLKASGKLPEAQRIVQASGFKALEDWAQLTLRITKAAAAVQIEGNAEMMRSASLAARQQASQLSAGEKAILERAIKQNDEMVTYLQNEIPEDDKKAVRPHLEALGKLAN